MASGDTLAIFTPLMNEPPSSNPATRDNRNRHRVLDFDASTDESAIFSSVLPQNYGGGGVHVYIHYACSTATSGNTVWQVQFERMDFESLDIDSDSFASAVTSDTFAAPSTSGQIKQANVDVSDGANMDNLAVGEGYRIKITRDADNASDTMAGDAEVLFVEIREQ